MELTNEVLAVHRQLSNCSADFLEYVKNNPKGLQREQYNLSRLQYAGATYQPWPTFINQHTREQFKNASTNVFKLIRSLPSRLFNNDPEKISQYFGIPKKEIKYQLEFANQADFNTMLSRGDFVMTDTGVKCLECNICASLGGWEITYLQNFYANVPFIAEFLQRKRPKISNTDILIILFTHIIQTIRAKFGDSLDQFNTVVMMQLSSKWENRAMQESFLTNPYQRVLAMNNLKGNIAFCKSYELKLSGNTLYHNNKSVHAVIEMTFGDISPDMYKAYMANKLCLFNGPMTTLLSNKFNISLLSEHQESDLFTQAERDAIKSSIPWTRKVVPGVTTYNSQEVNLGDFILANKDNLVIKPNGELGGKGVSVGRFTSQADWDASVKKAMTETQWLVQEFVGSMAYMYQNGPSGAALFRLIWGLFVFGDNYGGEWVRLLPVTSDKGVINRAQGAEEGVVLGVIE